MKNIVCSIIALAILFSACKTTSPLSISIDKDNFTNTVSFTSTQTLSSTITNTTNDNGSIAWALTETSTITGATYTISIDGNTQTGASGTFDIAANKTVEIIVIFKANGTVGNWASAISLTDQGNSKLLSTINYNLTASSLPPAPSFSISQTTASGSASISGLSFTADTKYRTIINNLTSNDLVVTWYREDAPASNPSAWTYATCDLQCLQQSSNSYTIPADTSLPLDAMFFHEQNIGSGSLTTHIYLDSDSIGTVQTFTASHSVIF